MSKYVVPVTWDEVPHLSEEQKADLMTGIPPYQRDARSKGIPRLGAGAIYPIPEEDVKVKDFKIPPEYVRGYAMDVGWKITAAGFFAKNLETGVTYLYSEHYRGEAEPAIHVKGIQARGKWLKGVIDPAARGRQQKDGIRLFDDYRGLGLDLEIAQNAREAGILAVWQALSQGTLKIFASCQNWLQEFRLYRRDDKGKIVKVNDHMMDLTRYFVLSGEERMATKPPTAPKVPRKVFVNPETRAAGWMA
jgi:hypothetical protein